jgi:hypothetical protein
MLPEAEPGKVIASHDRLHRQRRPRPSGCGLCALRDARRAQGRCGSGRLEDHHCHEARRGRAMRTRRTRRERSAPPRPGSTVLDRRNATAIRRTGRSSATGQSGRTSHCPLGWRCPSRCSSVSGWDRAIPGGTAPTCRPPRRAQWEHRGTRRPRPCPLQRRLRRRARPFRRTEPTWLTEVPSLPACGPSERCGQPAARPLRGGFSVSRTGQVAT